MSKCWVILLVFQIFLQKSEQRPIQNDNKEEALYAREVFTKLLRDVVLRDMVDQEIETPKKSEVKNHIKPTVQPNVQFLEYKDGFDEANNMKFRDENAVEVNIPVSSIWLSMHKNIFLDELQRYISSNSIKCGIASMRSFSKENVTVKLFCYYLPSSDSNKFSYVPSYKLKKLMESGVMKKFLEKYNTTSFVPKDSLQDEPLTVSASVETFLKKQWFPLTMIVVGCVFGVLLIVAVVFCCQRKKDGEIQDGEKIEEKSFEKTGVAEMVRKDLLKQSNVTPMSNNTYDISPKRALFSYSPNKMSTPIFSFTSPTKFKDKLVYPTSPIETSGPQPIQPQVELLYPSTLASTPSMRRLSGNSTTSAGSGSDKSRTLLQSRRGSSASLVIDVTPQTPLADLSVSMHESPTEEILMRKSRPLRFRELRRAQANDKELHEEFWGIPPNTVGRKDTAMKHSLKNRYPDILPNSRSIVRLKGENQRERYINANFVRRHDGYPNQYIATQGPLTNTINDFWQMIWQYEVPAIVMITKLKEKNKEKCCQYWPSSDTVRQETYGNITVTFDSCLQRDGYQISTLYATCKGSNETKQVTHYWFTAWPDHKVPKTCGQVVSLAQEVREAHLMKGKPIVVHCSAGRGRTGCFIAIVTGISQIDEDNNVDILRTVSQMRIDRGGMVDKDHQYQFIYSALYEYWAKKQQLLSPQFSRYSIEEADEEMESFDDEEEETHPPEYKRFSFAE